MAEIGQYSIYIAFLISILSSLFFIIGLAKKDYAFRLSALRGLYVIFGLLTLVMISLLYVLITSDFSVEYVAHYTNSELPLFYKITALWAGQSGSLVLWIWLLGLFTIIVILENKGDISDFNSYAYMILSFTFLFLLLILSFFSNPLKKMEFTPPDGVGMNPLLQNIWMIIHPPTLYLGYVGYAIPFSYAFAALFTGKIDEEWIIRVRKWSLLAWIFLTTGIFFGARWSYIELGWGGYWGWDPVENSSLIPWLLGTAFLHSIIAQERGNILKRWSIILIFLTYITAIFGTYISRSGIISSVHAFAQSPLGNFFLIYMVGLTILLVYLIIKRNNLLQSQRKISNLFSREGFIYLTNWVFFALAFVVFVGTTIPLFTKIFTGKEITVKTSFYNQSSLPFFAVILILMGICIHLGWRRARSKHLMRGVVIPAGISLALGVVYWFLGAHDVLPLVMYILTTFMLLSTLEDFWSDFKTHLRRDRNIFKSIWKMFMLNPRKYGGYVVHLGIALTALGIIGSGYYLHQDDFKVARGEKHRVKNFTLEYTDLFSYNIPNAQIVQAVVKVYNSKGKLVDTLKPQKRFYVNWENEPSSEVDIYPSIYGDLYISLSGWEKRGKIAYFHVMVEPLIQVLWAGTLLVILGGILAYNPWSRKG